MAASRYFNAHAVFADLEAAHAFLDVAEQAREGTVFMRGLEAAKGALQQLDAAVVEMPDPELVLARDRLKHRIERLITTLSSAS
jgi:hypothetical protein